MYKKFNALVIYEVTYLRRQVTLVFTAADVMKTKNDVSLYSLKKKSLTL